MQVSTNFMCCTDRVYIGSFSCPGYEQRTVLRLLEKCRLYNVMQSILFLAWCILAYYSVVNIWDT